MSHSIFNAKHMFTGSVFGRTGTGPPPTDDLTGQDRDALFALQLSQADDFGKLTAQSLITTRVCETKQYANSVISACHRVGIINKETGHPDTTRIDRSIVNKIAIISVPKQRELVNLLFFWEEEMLRWQLLCDEERELKMKISEAGGDASAKLQGEEALQILQAKKRVPPSLRDPSRKPANDALPGYE